MVDSLKTFNEGEYIYASETNSNNQYLLSKLSDNAAQVQTYVEGEISSIQSNVASVQATLQGNIDAANANITNSLKGRTFKQSAKSIGIGTTSLSSYLPNDGYAYQVWVYVQIYGTSSTSTEVKIATDVMTTARTMAISDGDSGRYSKVRNILTVPVGTGRKIITTLSSGSSDKVESVTLLGYAKL